MSLTSRLIQRPKFSVNIAIACTITADGLKRQICCNNLLLKRPWLSINIIFNGQYNQLGCWLLDVFSAYTNDCNPGYSILAANYISLSNCSTMAPEGLVMTWDGEYQNAVLLFHFATKNL